MPDHVHAIITILDSKGTARRALTEGFGQPITGSLPTIVRSYKSAVAKKINESRKTPGEPVWHRNYYEHVIRDESEMEAIIAYIEANPSKWDEDNEPLRDNSEQ